MILWHFRLLCFHLLFLNSTIALKTNDPQSQWKQMNLSHWRGQNDIEAASKLQSQRTVSIWHVWWFKGRLHFQGCLFLNWFRACLVLKALYLGLFVKKYHSQLINIMNAWGIGKQLGKQQTDQGTLDGNQENEVTTEGFENVLHIPRTSEGHKYAWRCAHA